MNNPQQNSFTKLQIENIDCIQISSDSSQLSGSIAKAIFVDERMSFSEAFGTARIEVGAGGVFEWRGHCYTTYYADEWDDLTEAEKGLFHNETASPKLYDLDSDEIIEPYDPNYDDGFDNDSIQPLGPNSRIYNLSNIGPITFGDEYVVMLDEDSDDVYVSIEDESPEDVYDDQFDMPEGFDDDLDIGTLEFDDMPDIV